MKFNFWNCGILANSTWCLEFLFYGALITNLKIHIPNIHNQTLPRTVDYIHTFTMSITERITVDQSYDPINQVLCLQSLYTSGAPVKLVLVKLD